MRAAGIAWHTLKRLPRPLLAVSASGWAVLAVQQTDPIVPALCLTPATSSLDIVGPLAVALAFYAPLADLPLLVAMLLAMAPPLLSAPLQHVWHRSLARRRARAVCLFGLGYAAVWLATGLLVATSAFVLGTISASLGWPTGALAGAVALAWQATPMKQVSLNRCHARPTLAAFGLRAETDTLAFGIRHGLRCSGACWAMMLVAFALSGPAHLIAMLSLTLASLLERYRPPEEARWGSALPRRSRSARNGSRIVGTTA